MMGSGFPLSRFIYEGNKPLWGAKIASATFPVMRPLGRIQVQATQDRPTDDPPGR